ncbi:hypothetical protein GFC01_15315 [Desulfofundulus thermobenzoicus]|uniref:Fibronectin type-III domain-containing protein n=1 Tax=Desulfofundulus thermobenzoicus TaxID=29376 RepID=A0A6N7IVV9_9FIRM|nr:hypothetical protein [Desulfofundulus thermobenzoicus]MQL53607.1 hypothetical protein [Desulfofundulus thermobenzoicus]
MRRNLACLLALLFALFAFSFPAFAVDSFTAARNEDGSVTLKWSGGEPGKKLTVQRSVGDRYAGGTDIAEVPQADGSYTDRTADRNTTYTYRLHYGIGAYTSDVTVQPYSPGQGNTGNSSPEPKDEGGLFERAIAAVFDSLYIVLSGLMGRWGFMSVGELILQVKDNAYDLATPAPFSPEQWRILDGLYGSMAGVGLALYLIAVLVTAGRFIGAGTAKNPDARAEAVSQLWRMFFALIIIAAAPVIVRTLYILNNALVEAIRTAAGGSNNVSKILSNDWLAGLQTGSVLGTALVKIVFVWAGFWINLIFWVRDWVVSVLYVFTPVMALLWTMNKNVTAASVWLGELLTNTFLQSAYALAAAVIVVFVAVGDIGWPQKLLGVYMIITLGNMLRNGLQGLWTRWAGIEEESVAGKALGMFGLGGVAGLGRLITGSVSASSTAGAPGGTGGTGAAGSSTINLQGTAAPPGTASPTGASPGTGAATIGSPPGWTVSPGGIYIPSSGSASATGSSGSAQSAAGLSGSVQSAAGGLPASVNPLIKSMDYGRMARNVVQGTVSTVGAVGATMMPGGHHILRVAAKTAGMAAQVAGYAGGMAYHSYQRARQGGGGTMETVKKLPGAAIQTLKEGTGVQQGGIRGAAKAAFKATTAATIDAVSPNSTPVVAKRLTGSSLDGYRFRP